MTTEAQAQGVRYPVYVVSTFGSMNGKAEATFTREYRRHLVAGVDRWAFRTPQVAHRFASECIGYGSITDARVYECDDADATRDADISEAGGRGWRVHTP